MIGSYLLVVQDAMQCGWDTQHFWLFSENVFSPLIYYSHTYPAGLCLLLAAIILPLDSKNPVNRLFFILSISFSLWCLFDFYLWAATNTGITMFVWSLHSFFEFMIFASAFFLLYYSLKRTHPSFTYFFVAFLLALPMILLMPTTYNLLGYDYTNCDREALEGLLWSYLYIAQLCTFVFIAFFGYAHQRTLTNPTEKQASILLTAGLSVFLFFFLLGNVVGNLTLDWSIAQYGLIGMPFLLAALGYSITKYQTFNVRITSSILLILGLMALLYAYIFI